MYTILVVEDTQDIYKPLCDLLEEKQFATEVATTQVQAIKLLEDPNKSFDLALVDILLPDGNGFSVFQVAKDWHVPVIFLTAMDDEHNTSFGLELGAADYVPKPYRPKELLSRINKALRDSGKLQAVYTCQDIVVDAASATVYKGGHKIFLTSLEYRLLLVFMKNIDMLLTRDQLFEKLWDITGSEGITENTLNVHIKRLREKVEDDPKNPQFIQTVRGLGYKVSKERQEG